MGVGSEVYAAVQNGRLGIGIELKPSYFRQAVRNLEAAASDPTGQTMLPTLSVAAAAHDQHTLGDGSGR
jgi:hypothetical protein